LQMKNFQAILSLKTYIKSYSFTTINIRIKKEVRLV
jgi:hypothetical protein